MTQSTTRVGSIAVGRSGDKGNTLDLTLVAIDDAGFASSNAD